MHEKPLVRRLAWGMILIALLAAAPVLWNRFRREDASRRVELLLDLPAARNLVRQEGYPLPRFLVELRRIGVTAVAIPERDLTALQEAGAAAVRTGAELQALVAETASPSPFLLRLLRQGRLDPGSTFVLPRDATLARELLAAFQGRLGAERVTYLAPQPGETGAGAIAIDAPPLLLRTYGAGFDPAEVELVRAAGLKPVLRPRPAPAATPDLVRAIFAEMERLAPEMNGVLFWGGEVLGYRKDDAENRALQATAAEMQRRRWIQYMIEHYTQLGFLDQKGQLLIPPLNGYRVARVYSMEQAEVDKYRPEVAVEKWGRAVLERNIRVLYLRPFLAMNDPGLTQVETTYKYYRMLVADLQRMGYPPGGPDLFAPYAVPWWQRGLAGLGAVGAGVLWLALTWPFRQRVLLALGALGGAGVLVLPLVSPRTGGDLIALASAVLFPTLAGTLLLRRWGASARRDLISPAPARPWPPAGGSLWREGAASFLIFAGVSVLGGLLVAAVLGDIEHMLEFAYFRGVKVALAAPLVLVAAAYFLLDRAGRPLDVVRALLRELRAFLAMAVRYQHVALGLLGALAVFWYIQRSGNFPVVPVPRWELEMRAWLERLLYVRPRTKEFAVAYPALGVAVAAAWYGWRPWILPALLAALTGASGGLVNSFEHLRTPWLISLVRGFNGFWLGALLAAAAVAVLVRGVRWLEAMLARAEGKGTGA